MTFWSLGEIFSVLAIGRRLGFLLLAVAVYCVVADWVVWQWDIHVFDLGGAASVIDTVILGLLLGFRNRVAYDRWWEARGLWGKLTNESRNLAGKLAAFVPAEALVRARAAETIVGFADALKRHLRDESPRLRDLPGFEKEDANPAHVPLYLANRLYTVVAGWRREGLVDQTVVWILDVHQRALLDVCGACEKIRFTPLSPSYKSLLRVGLVLNLLVAPWLTIRELGFWGVPLFELVCFFLLGVEMIDSVVEEPFGKERDDLDLDRYCRTIRDGVYASLPNSAKTKEGSP